MTEVSETIAELGRAGYLNIRLYRKGDHVLRWAAIRPYASGFAIASGDRRFVHNELWWFATYKQAIKSIETWETGTQAPPAAGGSGPRMITRKGKLKPWNAEVRS